MATKQTEEKTNKTNTGKKKKKLEKSHSLPSLLAEDEWFGIRV